MSLGSQLSLSDLLIRESSRCSRCAYCVEKCPYFIVSRAEGVDARSQLIIIKSLAQGGRLTESVIHNLFRCSLCKSCELACPARVKVTSVIIDMREKITRMGLSKFERVVSNIFDAGNVFGIKEYRKRVIPVGLEVIYLPGCVSSYRHRQIVEASEKVLAIMNVAYAIPSPENCCGFPLLVSGHVDALKGVVEKNLAEFQKLGANKIVTSCASCYWMIKKEYPERSSKFDFEVLHISELVYEFLNQGKLQLRSRLPLTVTYHDPCFLSRYLGFEEVPRGIIENIKESTFVEMPHSRKDSFCCGGIGEVFMASKTIRESLADYRMREAMEAGADLVITCCPLCYENLSSSKRASLLPVVDLTEIVASLA